MEYSDFLSQKSITDPPTGINVDELNPMLFDFQRDITRWALRRGRAAIFADCGMGKTPMQLEWANHIPGKVLIVAPLAVSTQTIREAVKFGIDGVSYSGDGNPTSRITITNYERLDKFDLSEFTGLVLDESSILKSYTGKFRTMIIERSRDIPFRLACTATPAPNDFMELGNHAEYMGTMTRSEMLAMFFIHDGGDTQKWRLKGHGQSEFWKWLCSWAVMIRKPSDLGYDDGEFILPPLNISQETVHASSTQDGFLFPVEARTMIERRGARRDTIRDRVSAAAALANASDEPWLMWCDLNAESSMLAEMIPDAVEVRGSDSKEHKESAMLGFSDGSVRVLVTKPSIAGFGMNWQHCANMSFVGLSDSYEKFYQAVRRCWRFGQTQTVNAHVITADIEGAVVRNIHRKEDDAARMAEMMVDHMHDINAENIRGTKRTSSEYVTRTESGRGWDMYLGDSIEIIRDMEPESIDFSVFSPPFASLYTYSNSDRDMGNSRDNEEFFNHFKFLIHDLFRVTKAGRLVSIHCMNLPTVKVREGYIGLRDFRGEIIRAFQDAGFIYHSEACIWKDPVTAMQRTKALGLLHKQIVKDSTMSRNGIPDYLVTMRKPGENVDRVAGEFDHFCGDESTFKNNGRFSIDVWQKYASPIWDDIRPGNTLQYRAARHENDERHICPLQLDVIHRAVQMWSNPGDVVFSPFAGIGSEGYEALKLGRRFIGIELKESYFNVAVQNLKDVVIESDDLFANIDDEEDPA